MRSSSPPTTIANMAAPLHIKMVVYTLKIETWCKPNWITIANALSQWALVLSLFHSQNCLPNCNSLKQLCKGLNTLLYQCHKWFEIWNVIYAKWQGVTSGLSIKRHFYHQLCDMSTTKKETVFDHSFYKTMDCSGCTLSFDGMCIRWRTCWDLRRLLMFVFTCFCLFLTWIFTFKCHYVWVLPLMCPNYCGILYIFNKSDHSTQFPIQHACKMFERTHSSSVILQMNVHPTIPHFSLWLF